MALRRAFCITFLLASLACVSPVQAIGQQSVSLTIEKTSEALSRTEDALDASRRAKTKLDAQVTKSKLDVLRVRRELIDAAAEAQDIEEHISALETDLTGLEEERREKLDALVRRRYELSRTLGALQRIGRTPPDLLIFSPASLQDVSHARLLLSRVAGELDARAEILSDELVEISRIGERASSQRVLIDLEAERLQTQRESLAALLARKTQAYDRMEAQHSLAKALVDDLAAEAKTMQELLERLVIEHEQNERMRHVVGAGAKEVAESMVITGTAAKQQGAVAVDEKPPVPSDGQHVASISVTVDSKSLSFQQAKPVITRKSDEWVPDEGVQSQNTEQDLSDLTLAAVRRSVSTARGTFAMPVRGELVSRFNEITDLGLSTKGIVIKTRLAAQIIAPYDGRIAFAGHFRKYGLLLIIDHGEGYHTVLAGMGRVDVKVGQSVLAGEPVGVMQAVANSAPRLYVELRSNGHPINPLPWLAAETIKVSG